MLLFLLRGLTIIFGMLGVVNFAHGALHARRPCGLPDGPVDRLLAALLVVASVALAGGLIERFTLRPLAMSAITPTSC